jgi:hypothetical protein
MTPLAVILLNRHKRSPQVHFFGTEKEKDVIDEIRQYGLPALDEAYKELTELGLVESCGLPVQIPAGRLRHRLTQKGRDAVPSAEKS